MPKLRTYRLFISHSWRHHDEYERFVDLLQRAPWFRWMNYSSPQHDPAIDPHSVQGKIQLEKALLKQIRPVHCVIVLSGLYVSHSYWIQREIDLAQRMGKPIIGVKPWGRKRLPEAVQNVAKTIVGWHTDSVVKAIRKYAL